MQKAVVGLFWELESFEFLQWLAEYNLFMLKFVLNLISASVNQSSLYF